MIKTTTHLDGTLGVLLNTDGLPAPRHDTRATQRQRQHRDKVSTSARQHHDKVMAPFGSCSTPMACRHDRTTGSSTGTEAGQQQKQGVTGTSEAGQYHNINPANIGDSSNASQSTSQPVNHVAPSGHHDQAHFYYPPGCQTTCCTCHPATKPIYHSIQPSQQANHQSANQPPSQHTHLQVKSCHAWVAPSGHHD